MSRFQFELATEQDDQQLRDVLRQTPMPGRISLSLEREPSFFRALGIEGPEYQVIACRDRCDGRIVGLGTRSVRQRYVNGQLSRVGYLGSLRLLKEHRSAQLVARGYRFFKELAEQDRVDWHFTSITDDNQTAKQTLTSGRAGLPIYQRIATQKTLVFTRACLKKVCNRDEIRRSGIEVKPATRDDLPAIVDLLNRSNSQHNLSLWHCQEDFEIQTNGRTNCTFLDLPIDHIHVARRGRELLGTVGVWDQSRFKQIVIRDMPYSWRWLLPLSNRFRSLLQQPPLVRVGERLPSRCAAAVGMDDAEEETIWALLNAVLRTLGKDNYFLLALDDRHSLMSQLEHSASMAYQNGIYLVGWREEELARFDVSRQVSLELGCL